MFKGIFTFIKRLVISFLIFCFVGVSGIFNGIFMCKFVKETSFGNALCLSNRLRFGYMMCALIVIFLLLFLSIKKKISMVWLFYLAFWFLLGYYFFWYLDFFAFRPVY